MLAPFVAALLMIADYASYDRDSQAASPEFLKLLRYRRDALVCFSFVCRNLREHHFRDVFCRCYVKIRKDGISDRFVIHFGVLEPHEGFISRAA